MTAIEIMFSPVEYIVTGFPLLKICPDPIHKLVQAHVTYQYLNKWFPALLPDYGGFLSFFFPSPSLWALCLERFLSNKRPDFKVIKCFVFLLLFFFMQ